MSEVAVVTDSCASIPQAMMESLNIHWVPYYIHRGKEVLRDLVTAQCDSFYRWLPTAAQLPTTASPGPGDYLGMYQTLAKLGQVREIISIHMTSKGSGAYQAARTAQDMAREMLPEIRIEVIDSLNVAMCHGWMVIKAAREALEGASLDQIAQQVREMIPVSQMVQTADTLRYLYMGGRIGRATHLVGSMLNIKPLIGMRDGVITALGRERSRSRAYRKMVALMEQAVGAGSSIRVAFVHVAAREEAQKIRALVEERFTIVESLIAELSPALGVHSGPGTAGVCFYPVS